MNDSLVIVDGVRTPFGKMGGALASLGADELGRQAVVGLLSKTGFDESLVDEVIFGCVAQPAEAMNLARVIALRAGIPRRVPAVTVHRNCASGFEAVTAAYEKMCAGHGEIFIVGGVESMSQVPLLLSHEASEKMMTLGKAKNPLQKMEAVASFRAADLQPRSGLKLGLTDPVSGLNMGETAELLAREYNITREAQDEFALRSHEKASAARAKFKAEITPVYLPSGVVTEDQGIRDNQTLAALAGLKPVFYAEYGSVTAGNSSQISDGAVALLVMREAKAKELGLKPLGRLKDYAYTGCDPARMGLGPVSAIQKLQERGISLADIDLVEINEAFAAQVIAVVKVAEEKGIVIPPEVLNVNGGGIAIGHPVGATGARLVLTTLLELRRRGGRNAIVSLCVGGGQGAALLLEAIEEDSL